MGQLSEINRIRRHVRRMRFSRMGGGMQINTNLLHWAAISTTSLLLACSANGGPADPPAPVPPPQGEKLTVVVLVIDSLMPSDTLSMPNLQDLIAQGTVYEESRAMFSAETIPNHVAMMTGVAPDRNGIPTNNFWDRDVFPDAPQDENISKPKELTANTLFTWIRQQCPNITTGATLSKRYLFEMFCGDQPAEADDLVCAELSYPQNDNPSVRNVQPDNYWDPTGDELYIPDPGGLTIDVATMNQALSMLETSDFLFINLGDVDRAAHAAGEITRVGVTIDTDLQVGRLVTALQDAGRWDNTVMIVVSDHGMDFSTLGADAISVTPTLEALAACGFAPMLAIDNGGTDNIYVTDLSASPADKQAALRAARTCLVSPLSAECAAIEATCGSLAPSVTAIIPVAEPIIAGWYTEVDPLDPAGTMPNSIMSAHPNLGDLVLVANDGLKFSEPDPSGNPIPGNHGHLETVHNFMLLTGGSPLVKPGQSIAPSMADPGPLERLAEQSENIDVAPTVAWLLGLNLAPGQFPDGEGFDGRVLNEALVAFDAATNPPAPTSCGVLPDSPL